MPTPAERKALLFLAAVAVIGGGVRLADSRRFERDVNRAAGGAVRTESGSPSDSALGAQLEAVDSARASGRTRGRKRSTGARRARRPTAASAPERAIPPSSAANERPTPRAGKVSPTRDEPLNVNDATATELERLPKVGPILAQRIVAWREAHGRFDSMEALRHVPGIGPATASLVAPLVTFSNGYRPSSK
jgi:competence protein ComEA